MNALTAIVADLLRQPIAQVGHTTFSPPYTPVTFGALAGSARGDLFEPVRQTPMHDQATGAGAVFENVGTWQRARYFPQDGEDMHRAVARECRAVRNGRWHVRRDRHWARSRSPGPMRRSSSIAYISTASTGSCLVAADTALLLSEAGYVLDDGVIARLAADRFHVTTTTGGAAACCITWKTIGKPNSLICASG